MNYLLLLLITLMSYLAAADGMASVNSVAMSSASESAVMSRSATMSSVIPSMSAIPVIPSMSAVPVIPSMSAVPFGLTQDVTPKPDTTYNAASIVESGSVPETKPFDSKNETSFPQLELAFAGVRGMPGRKISRPQQKDVCMSIEDGKPANFHYNDADQFVVMDGNLCKPVLSMVDDSCAAHMDIGTRCASFCQTSMFHSFGTPYDLMPGHVCREGEQCELKREKSQTLQLSNKVVDRHAKDTTVSITPGATWGFGTTDISIDIPGTTRKREIVLKNKLRRRTTGDKPALTGYHVIDSIMLKMREQAEAEAAGMLFNTASQPLGVYDEFDEEDIEAEGYSNGTAVAHNNGTAMGFNATTALDMDMDMALNDTTSLVGIFKGIKGIFKKKPATGPQNKASISLPVPTITNPAGSLSATLTRTWLHEEVHTHYRASQTGEFTSLTHKQVPGDGCGSFYLVPVQIISCGWQALPRVPRHMQEDVLNWLATSSIDDIDHSDFKRGLWSRDGVHKQRGRYQKPMWPIGPGGCPATYHEFPTCTSSFAKNADGSAMGRVVYVKKDCDSGRPLHHSIQPRPFRESVNFEDIFQAHLLKDPRLFNPHLGHLPPLAKAKDPIAPVVAPVAATADADAGDEVDAFEDVDDDVNEEVEEAEDDGDQYADDSEDADDASDDEEFED